MTNRLPVSQAPRRRLGSAQRVVRPAATRLPGSVTAAAPTSPRPVPSPTRQPVAVGASPATPARRAREGTAGRRRGRPVDPTVGEVAGWGGRFRVRAGRSGRAGRSPRRAAPAPQVPSASIHPLGPGPAGGARTPGKRNCARRQRHEGRGQRARGCCWGVGSAVTSVQANPDPLQRGAPFGAADPRGPVVVGVVEGAHIRVGYPERGKHGSHLPMFRLWGLVGPVTFDYKV